MILRAPIRRIAIVGPPGAGKSTLARRLGTMLDLPVVHLDSLYWQPGWVAPPPEEWQARALQAVDRERWVLDGDYSVALDLRLAAADMAIFLDVPRRTCLCRVILRTLRSYGRERADTAPGCRHRFTWSFLKWTWTYPRQRRPNLVRRLEQVEGTTRVIRLRTGKEIRAFLQAVPSGT
jgi:adenylate kinase family enzyme